MVLYRDILAHVYREIISASIALEKDLVIGYLGPEATYTHQAAVKNFGSGSGIPATCPIFLMSFQCSEASTVITEWCRLRIQREGAVNRSLDLLSIPS